MALSFEGVCLCVIQDSGSVF